MQTLRIRKPRNSRKSNYTKGVTAALPLQHVTVYTHLFGKQNQPKLCKISSLLLMEIVKSKDRHVVSRLYSLIDVEFCYSALDCNVS